MKILLFLFCVGLACTLLMQAQAAERPTAAQEHGTLRHVVAFKFKSTATEADIKKIENAFRELKTKIPQIADYEWGINNSPEGYNKGCTHGFILTFRTDKDRDAYLVHPEHKAFGALAKEFIDDVFVIDFWSRK